MCANTLKSINWYQSWTIHAIYQNFQDSSVIETNRSNRVRSVRPEYLNTKKEKKKNVLRTGYNVERHNDGNKVGQRRETRVCLPCGSSSANGMLLMSSRSLSVIDVDILTRRILYERNNTLADKPARKYNAWPSEAYRFPRRNPHETVATFAGINTRYDRSFVTLRCKPFDRKIGRYNILESVDWIAELSQRRLTVPLLAICFLADTCRRLISLSYIDETVTI